MNSVKRLLCACSLGFIFLIVVESVALIDVNLSSMAALDYKTIPSQEKALHVPPLEELAEVLTQGLKNTFEFVNVSVVNSPDLTQSPYDLTTSGLTGNAKLVEIGGPPYLVPLVQRDKIYDLAELLRHLQRDPAYLGGAGAGPWPYVGVNCEGIVNLRVDNGVVDQGTRVVSVQPVGAAKGASSYRQKRLPASETRSALLGNYLLTDGLPGKVLKVEVKKRIGESNFITAIRETLKEHYGDKVVGLGGNFVLREGRVKFHVMPDFSSAPLCSDSDVDRWLHYFEMSAPITHLGTLVTGDLLVNIKNYVNSFGQMLFWANREVSLDLRVQHFHGFSSHGDGGHYHYDTTPETVHYEGYFTPAASVLRLDPPQDTHTFGRD